jgi:hypothetical protein
LPVPYVSGMDCYPSFRKGTALKRMSFLASPADYRPPRAEIGRPSDFPISGRSRGPRRGRRLAGGKLASWKPETLGVRAARRGAGRPGPLVLRSGRVGRTRAAAMAAPQWPGGARRSRAQGCDFRGSPRRCSRKRRPSRVGAVPQERVQSTEHTRSTRRTPENRIRARADSYSVVERPLLYEISSGCPQERCRSVAR